MRTVEWSPFGVALGFAFLASGCGFVSPDPFLDNERWGAAYSPDLGLPARGWSMEEAELVRTDGSTLYALSRTGGLSVVDLADPQQPTLLGRRRVNATPVELALRGTIAIGVFRGGARPRSMQ